MYIEIDIDIGDVQRVREEGGCDVIYGLNLGLRSRLQLRSTVRAHTGHACEETAFSPLVRMR